VAFLNNILGAPHPAETILFKGRWFLPVAEQG